MEDNRLSKVEILIDQKRYKNAEEILSELLAEDTQNIRILSLLAQVTSEQGKLDIAQDIIDSAIGLSPNNAELFFIKSEILIGQGKLNDAEKNIKQAIALNPHDARYFGYLAFIFLEKKEPEEALKASNKALNIDATNLLALNMRATAFQMLDRHREAFLNIENALREDPINASTHTNYAWMLFEEGNYKKALVHFKKALEINPTSEYAQRGLNEVLKTKNPFYRILLSYSIFIDSLETKYIWALFIGLYIALNAFKMVIKHNTVLQPYATTIFFTLSLLAFSRWTILPINNLFFRERDNISGELATLSWGLLFIGLFLFFLLLDARILSVAAYGLMMIVPFAVIASSEKGCGLVFYTVSLALIGLVGIAVTFFTGEVINSMMIVFTVAACAFLFWVSNYHLPPEEQA